MPLFPGSCATGDHPPRPRFLSHLLQRIFLSVLVLLVCRDLLGNWQPVPAHALTAQLQSPAKGVTTYQQFMRLPRAQQHANAPAQPKLPPTPLPSVAAASKKSSAKPLPSAEPPKMKPIRLALTPFVTSANQVGSPLVQLGSDHRLEVQVPAGSLDITNAHLSNGARPAIDATGGLTLQVTQTSGHYAGLSSVLGLYNFEIVDRQGHVVQGVTTRKPLLIIYHYTTAELKGLGIDPGHVLLTWPQLIAAARQAKKPTTGLSLLMTNNKKTLTLTVQTTLLAGAAAISSVPTIQQAPKPHLASVQGNSGNLTYSYPIQMPPGPDGLTPKLAFNYSSATPNERHSPFSPANALGDGWTLGMGSITAENYPDTSSGGSATWFFLSGPDGVSDRLVPDPNNVGFFYTQHLSHYRIHGQDMNSNTDTPSCFHVWDTSGTYYEYGCTSDSLQYVVDSNGNQTTYRWDLDLIVPPREGPTSTEKQIKISYFQDLSDDATGNTSVRDSVMAQIVYQTLATPSSTNPTIDGTIDFSYRAPAVPGSVPSGTSSSWITAYGDNFNCQDGNGHTVTPPNTTTLRCDNPNDHDSDHKAPAVMSVFSLESMTVYVGADTANHPAYGYSFNYLDTPFYELDDPITQDDMFAAGEHLLTNITPIVYQNGTAHNLKEIAFSYTQLNNTYYDSTQTANDGNTQYQLTTKWQYLDYYVDLNTNIGEVMSYQTAYSNTHGTPYVTDSNGVIIDDRHDPFYCTKHANDSDTSKQCTGDYAHPDDQSWSVQVVTNEESLGKDSGDPNLQHATYNYTYTLGTWGTYATDYSSSGSFCTPAGNPAPAGEDDCTFDTYINGPPGGSQDGDWQDFYHGEFRGFGKVYITPPNGNLIVESYYSPEAWGTPAYDPNNYQSGSLIKKDLYQGSGENDSRLLQETVNQYSGTADFLPSGNSPYSGACTDTDVSDTYTPCEIVLVFTKTTQYEQTGKANTNAPWVQMTYTYDDYNTSGGLQSSGYHNRLSEQITSSNAPTLTRKWSYVTNDSTDSTYDYIYHTVNAVSHSEIDDASGHIWQCTDTNYDQGLSGITTPAAGWPTTVKAYSDCNHPATASTTFTTYTGYDSNGNPVATVDAFGAANSGLYGSAGCTLATAPVVKPSAWTASRYTTCTVYDSYFAQATSQQNVLGQTVSTTYDDTQGRAPISSTDVNGQITSATYSYDSSGNQTLQVKAPGETGSSTTQSSTFSTCDFSSTRPCYEIDNTSSQYPGAISRTFYDAQGRATETRKPLDATHDVIAFTVYNEWNDSKFESQPFRVASGSSWIDPYVAKDDQGNTPVGTITMTDALGRTTLLTDALGKQTTTTYSISTLSWLNGDNNLYESARTIDANQHVHDTYTDALNDLKDASPDGKDTPANEKTPRIRYALDYTGIYSGTLTASTLTTTQYNALNKPTSVVVLDLAPNTRVTTTLAYNDLGWLTTLNDPDRGTHTYTYNANGKQLTDVSGSRTIGTSYDLLGRARCVQDTAPTNNGSGNCASGSHPLIQATYDTTMLGTKGSTDFPVGQVTKSVATTYYPDGTSATVTEQFQYNARGKVITETQQLALPTNWNVATALPTYQMTQAYNDADQPTTTQTTVGSQPGYTFTNVYDSTTGQLTGLSNNSNGIANLVKLSFNAQAQISDLTFQATIGTTLADLNLTYDGDLRPAGSSATWQSGSGSTGSIFGQSLSYDAVGNVISKTTNLAAISGQSNSGGGETENFCYDEQNRMVWAGNSGIQPSAGNGTCGSPGLFNTLGGNSYSSSYTYTNLGQISQQPLGGVGTEQQALYCTSSHPHQLSGLYPLGTTCAHLANASYSASYDAFGNQTSRTYNSITATLSYDALDHLTQWNAGNTNQGWYVYNASGQRLLQRSTTGGGINLTVYAFGLEEHVYNGNGNHQSDTYYYMLQSAGNTDQQQSDLPQNKRLVGTLTSSGTQFYITDSLGSVLSTFSNVAGSALILGSQVYNPYGTKGYNAGSMGTAKGFTGQYADSTGLDYYNARYYDPITGQFLSADVEQGNTQGMNPYAYVHGNPETKNDPTGHWDWTSALEVAGVAVAVAVAVAAVIVLAVVVLPVVVAAITTIGVALAAGATGVAIAAATEAVGAALTGVFIASIAASAAGIASAAASCGALSFRADTLVATAHGEQAIGTLSVGEKVWAYNTQTRKMELEPIQHVWLNHDMDLVDLTLIATVKGPHGKTTTKAETLHTNERHPFLTREKGFIPVSQLKPGMHVLTADGSYGMAVTLAVAPGAMWMYNLTVAYDHTYTVGTAKWIVHNYCFGDGSNARGFASAELLQDHWGRHKGDFNFKTPGEYEDGGLKFVTGAKAGDGTITGLDLDRNYGRYDPRTGEFAVLSPDGILRTYYKPTSPDFQNTFLSEFSEADNGPPPLYDPYAQDANGGDYVDNNGGMTPEELQQWEEYGSGL